MRPNIVSEAVELLFYLYDDKMEIMSETLDNMNKKNVRKRQ